MNIEYKLLGDGIYEYCIKEKYDGQTYYMSFYFNSNKNFCTIYLRIYSKRKEEFDFENEIQETGKNPFYTYRWAIKAFKLLEERVISEELSENNKRNKITFMVSWLDNRRRDAYYKILSKYGYNYEYRYGKKTLVKEVYYEGKSV